MSGAGPEPMSPEWMRTARRDQALQAIEHALAEIAFEISAREEGFIRRNPGCVWGPDAEWRYRTIEGARALVQAFYVGSRDIAIEVAAKNKSGKSFERMPAWIDKPLGQMVAAFTAPLPRQEDAA